MASQETFPDSISRPFAALIALTICLGVFLRFWALDEKLAWHDEVATRIWHFKEDGIEDFQGPYSEWKGMHN